MIYLVGSLRNPGVPRLGMTLRAHGHEVFDDWYSAGPEADDKWREYEVSRGRSYAQAMNGAAAWNTFRHDQRHIDKAAAVVLVMPCGKSGHLELGYAVGSGKPGYVYFPGEPERWDVMYRFARAVAFDISTLINLLEEWK